MKYADKTQAFKRFYLFLKFSLQERDVKLTFVDICQEVSDFLAMPVDVKLESINDFKAYEANRIQEKIDNMPISSDLMLDIWDSYCQLRNTKIGSELICHTIMTMSGIQNDHWCTDHVDRSPWIEVICDMLSKELSFTGNFEIPAG